MVLLPTLCNGVKVGKKLSGSDNSGSPVVTSGSGPEVGKNLGVVVKKLAGTEFKPRPGDTDWNTELIVLDSINTSSPSVEILVLSVFNS